MKDSFAPSVVLPDGSSVTPPGWMFVFAFAMRGVEWAEKECSKPEFDRIVRQWFIDRELHALELETKDFYKHRSDVLSIIANWRRIRERTSSAVLDEPQ